MDRINPILSRKMGLTPPDAAPSTEEPTPDSPVRQMRRALARAMDETVGLSASVSSVAEEDSEAESLIEDGPDDWIVLGLREGASAGLSGVFLMDPPLRSALVEMQTMGYLLPVASDQRKVTRTDAVMSVPFADKFLKELADAGFGQDDFDMAAFDIGPMEDLRTAGLMMAQGTYRVWRVSIHIAGGDHHGEVLIALRPKVDKAPVSEARGGEWATKLRAALEEAHAELDAVLTKFSMPISKIERFEVGQLLTLAGTTVGSVTLTGPAGEAVATARLGQVAGKRAVRTEVMDMQLQDDTPKPAAIQNPSDGRPRSSKGDLASEMVEG
ncbi:FliM/FliN family flagellar motor switch protein [Octadecabacter sp. 1_MG-2023]|uniref:FliM/FliN family flagellar motor switch protein n=1 Tax=unclassified Octadecabacter TaxID=196158 RepID=UPI001C096AA3|nr:MULTISPECIES: FliM/FliN family flagellar motor switch protein [unclassified Octadecabacter]MBU2993006.1 FliM/FliN family flagellar motor switch protein [Octadecabacter sp. B2R22]MDO6733542.1 FliM/FliN family flagellar motor switch protein [Octadecabacter sp. 1_MG-2023]